MDWNWYLFGFQGRIKRAKFWLSFFILLGWMLFILWVMIFSARLVTWGDHIKTIEVCFGINETSALIGRMIHGSFSRLDASKLAGNLFGMTVLWWIVLAISIKRLHDRDRSGWWIVPFFVAPSFTNEITGWLDDSFLSFLAFPVAIALFILCIWGFIEMGFLRGSFGTNRFGPNPRATSVWDQQTDIEFAPHIGSPPPGMHVKRGHD
jgi:uncharacterized membrane protein YhaH (DUF805 family)